MLRWEREPAGSSAKFAKFVVTPRDMVAQLTAAGFERDYHLGASFHLPLHIDLVALKRGVESGDLAEAVSPIAAALQTARATVPLFEPLVTWTQERLDD